MNTFLKTAYTLVSIASISTAVALSVTRVELIVVFVAAGVACGLTLCKVKYYMEKVQIINF